MTSPRRRLLLRFLFLWKGPEARRDEKLVETLQPLLGAIDVEAMREANFAVDREDDKRSPAQAARALAERIGL